MAMKQIGASAMLPLDLLTKQDSASAPDRASYCLQRVRTMYDCYRKSDAFNPEVFAAASASILAEYDLNIVDFITDPRTGLPSKIKWPPEPKEVRDACDAIVKDQRERAERDTNLRKQFADRREFETEQAERGKRLTYDELVAKHGKDFGLGGNDPQDKADAERRLAAGRAAADRLVRDEYKSIGAEPEYASEKSGILISPALADYGRRHAERMADHVKARSREPKA